MRRFLIGGGDGTLNGAIQFLLGRDVTLGVLPLGTGNDFARSLGIAPTLEAACDVIAAGYTARVDVGLANGRPFLNAVSLGLASAIARRLTPELKRRAGKLAYPVAAVAELWEHQPFHVRMTTDRGEMELDVLQLVVGNGRYHGAGNVVTPESRIDDRRLDAYTIAAPSSESGREGTGLGHMQDVSTLARIALSLRRGEHVSHPAVTSVHSAHLYVDAPSPRRTSTRTGNSSATPRCASSSPPRPCASTRPRPPRTEPGFRPGPDSRLGSRGGAVHPRGEARAPTSPLPARGGRRPLGGRAPAAVAPPRAGRGDSWRGHGGPPGPGAPRCVRQRRGPRPAPPHPAARHARHPGRWQLRGAGEGLGRSGGGGEGARLAEGAGGQRGPALVAPRGRGDDGGGRHAAAARGPGPLPPQRPGPGPRPRAARGAPAPGRAGDGGGAVPARQRLAAGAHRGPGPRRAGAPGRGDAAPLHRAGKRPRPRPTRCPRRWRWRRATRTGASTSPGSRRAATS